MFYFIFFFLHFIIADDKNDQSPTKEQTILNSHKKNISSTIGISTLKSQESTNHFDKSTQQILHTPHKTLQRIKGTRNFPKFEHGDESTTIGLENDKPDQVKPPNPLRRRNAKINIPKIELDDDDNTISQNKKDTNQIQPNPDFDNEEAFQEDKSDPFDEKDDETDQTISNTPVPPMKTPTPSSQTLPTETSSSTHTETLVMQREKEMNSDSEKNNNEFTPESAKKTTIKKKMAKFNIVSISPRTVSTRGDEKIEITMNTTLDGPPFIKFGEDKIVHGRHSKKDLTVKCRTPRLTEGDINVSVSIDKVKWSEPYSIVVVADEADLPWIFVGCAGIAIIAVSLMVSKLICGKRAVPKKKKSSKTHNDDIMNILAPNYRSNTLHKRTKVPTEV